MLGQKSGKEQEVCMSSPTVDRWSFRLLLLASFVLLVWYANNQLLYTLRFGYQLLRFLAPGLVPDFGPPG